MSNGMQQNGVYILLQYHSTGFGCRPHPSSGVHKTVVTVTGTSHMIVQLPHSNVAWPRRNEIVAHPSSGVYKTVVTATGTSHMIV